MAFKWPPAHYNKGSEWVQTVNRVGQQIYQTIRDYPGSHNARVFFTAPGPVDDMLLRYHGLADNLKFWCPNQHVSNDLEVFRKEIDAADFVVASDPGSSVVYENMIAPNIQTDSLRMAQENSHLTELTSFPALNGKSFHIFVRRDLPGKVSAEKPVPFEDPWSPLYRRK
jgi:hypothetical protein